MLSVKNRAHNPLDTTYSQLGAFSRDAMNPVGDFFWLVLLEETLGRQQDWLRILDGRHR